MCFVMKMNFIAVLRPLVLLGALLIGFPAAGAIPAGLDLGTDNNFAFIDLGATTLGWNSGPVAGNVLFGLGLQANLSGGNNGGISNGGVLSHDSSAVISGALQNPITQTLVSNTITQNAATIAQNVSSFASSLTPTQTFTTINNTTTITGNGGLNVIDVANIQNAKLTLSGTANDFFVFNVSNAISTNQPMILSGGVSPSNILFNLTGTGTVFQTSGGDVSFGTYLATNGGKFQFSNLVLTGRLINIGGDVQLVSGSSIPTVPEPGTLGLVGIGAIVLVCALKKSRSRDLRG
jgi:PEP-CTERM motif